MPLYEYKCQQCQRHTEKRQKFSDPEITDCPHCGGHLERVISAPAIAFKGGGWYADGYGNAKPKTASEGKPGGEGKPGSEGKTAAGAGDSPSTASGTADSSGSSASAAAPAISSAPIPAAAPAPAKK